MVEILKIIILGTALNFFGLPKLVPQREGVLPLKTKRKRKATEMDISKDCIDLEQLQPDNKRRKLQQEFEIEFEQQKQQLIRELKEKETKVAMHYIQNINEWKAIIKVAQSKTAQSAAENELLRAQLKQQQEQGRNLKLKNERIKKQYDAVIQLLKAQFNGIQ